MREPVLKYARFLLKILQIGCMGFGGGNALIPVIEQILLGDCSRKERKLFDRDIIVANLTPGALPVEILSSVGRRSFGIAGMITGATAFALPGAVIAVLILMLFSGNETAALSYVKIASAGISAFIICLLITYVSRVIKASSTNRGKNTKTILMIVMVFFVVCGKNIKKLLNLSVTPLFGVSTLVVLAAAFFCVFYVQTFQNRKRTAVAAVLCIIFFLGHGQADVLSGTPILKICEIVMVLLAVYGAVDSIKKHHVLHHAEWRLILQDAGCWGSYMLLLTVPVFAFFPSAFESITEFIGMGCISSLMSFGGGDAYLAVAEGLFVDSGLISYDHFYSEVVTVVNVTPGSILCKTLSSVGFVLGRDIAGSDMGGILFALAGFGCSVAMSCIAFGVVYHLYDSLIELQMFMALSRWIRPIVAGLLINVALSLVNQSMALCDYADIGKPSVLVLLMILTAVNMALKKKVPDIILLTANIAAAFLWVSI